MSLQRFPRQINGGLTRLNRSAGAAVADPLLFFDTFTGANGTPINSRSPDVDVVGGGWTIHESAATIQGNECQPVDLNAERFTASADCGAANVTLTCIYTNRAFILFRFADINNLYFVRFGVGFYRVQSVKAGVTELVGQNNIVNGLDRQGISIVASGNNYSITVGGETLTFSDTFNNTATRFGVGGDRTVARVDDFKIEAL
jgi:hypothetical protein